MSFREWLFGPREECKVCHELRSQLDFANSQNKYLLDKHFEPQVVYKQAESTEAPAPVGKAPIPWNIRKTLLEAEDRKTAQLMRDRAKELKNAKSVDELEKSLDIEPPTNTENELKEAEDG